MAEITVEAALAELREMFPSDRLSIEYADDAERVPRWRAVINTTVWTGLTLADCMAQVRTWRKANG